MAWQAALSIVAAVALYGAVHSWLAGSRTKAWAARALGLRGAAYRLAFNIFATLTFLPVLALPALFPNRVWYRLPFPWAGVALAVQGVGVLIVLDAVRRTGLWAFLGLREPDARLSSLEGSKSNANDLAVSPPNHLRHSSPSSNARPTVVVAGPYRWTRHPIYFGSLLFLWASPLMTRNQFWFYLALSGYLLVGSVLEERRLARELGAPYLAYRRRVRDWDYLATLMGVLLALLLRK